MKTKAKISVVVLLLGALVAAAQTTVISNQGNPGKSGPWPVTISSSLTDGGTSSVTQTQPRLCRGTLGDGGSPHQTTTVGGTATVVPPNQTPGRLYVNVCSSPQNTAGTVIKCLTGNIAPVYAITNRGDVLTVGDCVMYAANYLNVIQCIADSAGREVLTYECVP